ncbi:MAG: DNA mismatch repair protein MutS [Candidatus Thalassarchaeum sp.]|nr:DNA mismatch repair protein MutS [Candidatus Thalassarchaeum sp.]MEC8938919.1 DNA mismatch repair protein MutS [Candidatus Thermoplasmatota archaeon]MEC9350735.1 DNA mismatch repair protein MutS [Candidatus Thermoplasmatota archaeon]MEC9478206.1 DNA mismatch repair protein MutS [Candidatus Thermoplasmatota archaeon]MED6312914.1 DNA mismatch repair protein MutS [Candidatus Thermoplasmatota archaeon]
MAKRSMLDQFAEIKAQHPDTVLFFRMGDFYEMFYDDAVLASEVLGITLTSRDKSADDPVPMAGVPWHSVETYLQGMLRAGHKVTLCEQEEELRPGSKILERVVTRVYTPGSLYEEDLIGEDGSSLLAGLVTRGDGIGLAILDSSTGRAWLQEHSGVGRYERLRDELQRWSPSELVLGRRDAESEESRALLSSLDSVTMSVHEGGKEQHLQVVRDHLELVDLGSVDLDRRPLAMEACGLTAGYLAKLHLVDVVPLREVHFDADDGHLVLDQTTLRNLELTHTLAGEKEGSLVQAIDCTRTWMGRRQLKEWILRPLTDSERIAARQSAVASLIRAPRRLDNIRETLKSMRDLERLSTRLAYGRANARDLVAVADCLERMPRLQGLLTEGNSELLHQCAEGLSDLDPLMHHIASRVVPEPPMTIREGGIFQTGVNEKLDNLRQKAGEGTDWLKGFESRERERLDIPSLKVKQNRQFGFFIEVTKSHLAKIPEEYRRRQTMTNAERYTTDELKEWEEVILTADDRAKALEHELFLELRREVASQAAKLSELGRKVASADVLTAFASHARKHSWNRPDIKHDSTMEIVAGRHPVLEDDGRFVPNGISFDKRRRFLLLTGPNMGGKSTYLRQTALITILAQAGSFVPAEKAKIGIVDRVFTRVGAHDDLRRGRSTFMMEMIEVAHILRRATPRSLVLLDEVGRGTSTFDGLAIAWSVSEDIATRVGARTLFATHYHQLVGLAEEIDGLVNIHVQVADVNGEIRFLHTVADGPCDDSYGVQVAALAGLPSGVVERARDLLIFLEGQAQGARAGSEETPDARESGQSSLYGWMLSSGAQSPTRSETIFDAEPAKEVIVQDDPILREIAERLEALDPDTLTPREALEALYAMRAALKNTVDGKDLEE